MDGISLTVTGVLSVQASTACNQKGNTMSDITLSSGIRQNLLSLQNTAADLTTTQEHLATGKTHYAGAVFDGFVGETRAMAEEKFQLADSLARPIDTLSLLSEAINFDFGSEVLEEPKSDIEAEEIPDRKSVV